MHSMVAPISPSHITYSKEKENEMAKRKKTRTWPSKKLSTLFNDPPKMALNVFLSKGLFIFLDDNQQIKRVVYWYKNAYHSNFRTRVIYSFQLFILLFLLGLRALKVQINP